MDINLFQSIILSYQQQAMIKLTKRDLELDFIPNMALGIVGVRRCGKTFRTHQLALESSDRFKSSNICRVQFNDHRIKNIHAENLHIIDDAYYTLYPDKNGKEEILFIFDEIHRIKGWEDYILYLLENPQHKIIVTGSTASLLKGQFASQLRGKIFPVEEYPFSFREFLRHYEIAEDHITSKGQSFILNAFTRYMKQGGFPGLLDIAETLHVDILRTYWDTMLLRDIIEAHGDEYINIAALRYFTDALISRTACPMTTSKIANQMKTEGFKFSKNSLYDYLYFLADAYMIQTVDFYSKSERVKARNYKKVYCMDWALARAVCGGESIDETRILENIVYVELCRRGFDINYYRTKEGFEIDFVISKRGKPPELVQVAFSIENSEVKNRELRAIEKSAAFLNADQTTIITFNETATIKMSNCEIAVVPIWRWLLED
jgi:uncharacterized protein